MSPRTLAAWLAVFAELRRRDRCDPDALGRRLRELVDEEENDGE